jgi:DtxR family Mn-dependent transcriptional regulator
MNALTPSLEDYLETVWVISQTEKAVRIKNIVSSMGVSAASVVGAMKTLAERDLLVHERYGYVELTEEGSRIAKEIYRRHEILTKFFHEILGVDIEIARKDACQVEHHLNKETFERIVRFLEFLDTYPEGEPPWFNRFKECMETSPNPKTCARGSERDKRVKKR